jgi:hypothetical protein
MGDDGKLYYYLLDIVGGKPLSNTSEVVVSRAQCRNKGNGAEYRVEGTTRNPDGASHEGPVDVNLITASGGIFTSMTTSVLDPAGDFATWAIRDTITGSCQDGEVVFRPTDGPSVSTTFAPDIR